MHLLRPWWCLHSPVCVFSDRRDQALPPTAASHRCQSAGSGRCTEWWAACSAAVLQTADWCTANTIFTAATSPLQRCMWCTFLMSLCLRCQRNFSIFPKCIILFKDYALLNDLIFIVITSPCTCLKALSQPIIVEHILKSSSLNHVNFSDTHLLCG